jgi:DNA-binding GntR family transcriptional regulator
VSSPTRSDLREIFEVRLALESTAAFLAALHGATDGLTKTTDQLRCLIDANSTDVMLEQRTGWLFHAEMFAAAQNERFSSEYEMLRVHTGLALSELIRHDAATVRRGTLEHLNIYTAIKANDAEAARRHAWNHIIDATDASIEIIRGKNEYSS